MDGLRVALNHTYLRREGGVERYVYNLTKRLLESGCHVDFYGIKKDPGVSHSNLRFIKVPVVKGLETFKILSFAFNSASLIRKNGPYHVVMGFSKTFYHNVYRDGSGCREDYIKGMGVKITPKSMAYEAVIRFIEKRRYSFPNLDFVVTVSKMVKEQIQKRHPGCKAKIVPLYSAVELSDFMAIGRDEARRKLFELFPIRPEVKLLLFVGNDFERKGLRDVFEALSFIDPGLWALFVLGEDRKNMERYKDLSRRMGLEKGVFFLGFRHDRALFFRGSHIFTLPSRFDAIANVILEALVSGTFVLSSPASGGTELLREGIDGFRINGTEDLKKKLQALIMGRVPIKRTNYPIDLSWEAQMRFLGHIFSEVRPL